MERNYLKEKISHLKTESYFLIVGYLRFNHYIRGYIPRVFVHLYEVFGICNQDCKKMIDAYQAQPIIRQGLINEICLLEKELDAFTQGGFIKLPGTEHAESTDNTEFSEIPDTATAQAEKYGSIKEYEELENKLPGKAKAALSNYVTSILKVKIRKPSAIPPVIDNGYQLLSPLFSLSMNRLLVCILVSVLLIGEWGLYDQILSQVFFLQSKIVGVDKSLFMGAFIVAFSLFCCKILYTPILNFMRQQSNHTVVRRSLYTLGIAGLGLIFINSILFYDNIETARKLNDSLNDGTNAASMPAFQNGTSHLMTVLKFLAISLSSAISVLVSSVLTVSLAIYAKLNNKYRQIIKAKQAIEWTYEKEQKIYHDLHTNKSMVYSILLNIKMIQELQLELTKEKRRRFRFPFTYSIFIPAFIVCLSSCSKLDPNRPTKQQNSRLKTIAIGNDISGSIDTSICPALKSRLATYLQQAIKDSVQTKIWVSEIGNEVGLNDRRQYMFQPIAIAAPSSLMNNNDRKRLEITINHKRKVQKDSFVNAIIGQVFQENRRTSNTALLEYLCLLGQVKQTGDSIDVLIISDLKQDSKLSTIPSFTNKNEALQFAAIDLKKMKASGVDSTALNHVTSIQVILPEFKAGGKDFVSPFIQSYWNTVLNGLSAKNLIIYTE